MFYFEKLLFWRLFKRLDELDCLISFPWWLYTLGKPWWWAKACLELIFAVTSPFYMTWMVPFLASLSDSTLLRSFLIMLSLRYVCLLAVCETLTIYYYYRGSSLDSKGVRATGSSDGVSASARWPTPSVESSLNFNSLFFISECVIRASTAFSLLDWTRDIKLSREC